MTEKTKAIMLCSPNNPTGSMLNKNELKELAKIVEKHDLLVIADEIYGELVYDEEYTSLPSIPGMRERTILVSGFSKTFAMTGWRLDLYVPHLRFQNAMLKIHQYAMMCASNNVSICSIRSSEEWTSRCRRDDQELSPT